MFPPNSSKIEEFWGDEDLRYDKYFKKYQNEIDEYMKEIKPDINAYSHYVKKSNVGKLGTALPLDRHEVERALDLVRKVISHCATVLPEYADPNEGVKEMVDCRRQ